jgi:SPP1 gp7 family putative phage head morphogenesis protein
VIPVQTHWIPHARRQRLKLTQAQKRLGRLQAVKSRMLGAMAARDIVPLWQKHVVQPLIAKALGERHDAKDPITDDQLAPLFQWFVAHSANVAEAQRKLQAQAGLAVKPSHMSARVQQALVASRQSARALIKNASQDFSDDLKVVLDDPKNIGARVENIRDQLIARGHVSDRRAELIARDQTYKLNAAVTRAHHEDAGVTSYWWSTSLDERVRPAHVDLEGQVFQYSAPSEEGNPGDPVNCRCVAIPVFDDDEDASDDSDE